MFRKFNAELIGTFWLVFGGCGSAIFAAQGIGLLGVSLAFGLTVVTMAYAIGPISGCHLNPAVSLGLWAGGRFNARELVPYILAQLIGGVLAGGALYLIASGSPSFDPMSGFAANGYGAQGSPGSYSLQSVLIAEVLLTAFFLIIIMGATDKLAPAGFAPIAIGLGLTLIHLISIPIDNTSVNPARSLGVALFANPLFQQQLWAFFVAPLVGGVLGALAYRAVRKAD
ncbi:aquaporin Z [Pseudomonas sp. URMO17WK12:I11]|uniref:aquaporin Z n=1 Tax=Pseudomonas sp. URMO17WK12:I11 TaxID=1283291 RepID=UPI000722BBF3|nr:aquaporin Z [Pseudomonas sp. URMO17WK12:I11]CRL51658.1 Aquaporin Z [Pseudomonas sp. URMO17WK12:I11]